MKWQMVSLDSLKACSRYSFVGGPFGSNLTSRDYVEEGVPVIRGTNLSSDREFLDEGFVFVREEKADALRSNTAHAGDLVFTQRGTLGQVGIIPETPNFSRYIISQSQMKLTVDAKRVNSRYVYYYFRHPKTIQKVINHALTSGVPHINLGILKGFEIPLPPVSVQTEIASILSTYDELIENNQRRMTLLEDAARQVYQEWFVRLRFPGCEHIRVVDGVPKGWEKVKVGSLILKFSRANKIKKDDYQITGAIPCVDQGSDFIGGYTDDVDALLEDPLPIIVFGDHTRVLKFINFPFASGADGTQLIYPNTPRMSTEYFYFALKAIDLSNYFYARHFKFLKEEDVLVPAEALVREFTRFAATSFEQIKNLRTSNDKLRTARDLLLPKLMSGEIVV